MSLCKRLVSLCLCLAMLSAFLLIPVQSASSFPGVKGPTLVKQNGTWYYVKNGAICYDTTLVKFSGSWYYVKGGTTHPNMTTLVKYNNEWWYVVNGKVASNTTSLVKYNNEWWYVVKGKVASNTTTLVKYNNEWWYVVKGKIAGNTTTLVKYNNEWWYIVKGKVASNTTTLVKYNNEWWYVVKGKIAGNTTNLIKYNNEWWYVVKGKVASNTTTLMQYNGGWYYISKGKLAANTTTLVKHVGKWYYVEKGKVNFNVTTLVPFSNQWYYIKNGTTQPNATTLVKYDGQFHYVKNGVYTSTTCFCTYEGQKYYVEEGIAQTTRSGKVTVNGSTYFIKNGVLTNCHSAGHSAKAATCTTAKVCSKCSYVISPALGHKMSGNTCTRCGLTKGEPITLTVWANSMDQAEDGWMQQMQEAFEVAHPEYNITWVNEVCSEGDAGYCVADDPEAVADVYMFANDQLGTLIQAGALTPLSGNALLQVKNDNSQTMINTVTYTDGKIYGFPTTNNTWFMYYNKKTFSAQDVKSLNTMLDKGVVAFPLTTGWYSGAFFFANGGKLFGDKGNDASAGIQLGAANGGYEAALTMVKLASHSNFRVDENGLGYSSLRDGSVDAYFSGSWDYAALKEALGEYLGAVQLPTVEIGGEQKQLKSFAGSKAVGVNPHSENKAVAMEFAAFLSSVDAQKTRYEMRGVIPAAKALANDPEIKSNPVAMAEINTMTNCAVVQPTIPEMSNYWVPMASFGALLANGEVTEANYKEAVEKMMVDFGSMVSDTLVQGSNAGPAKGVTVRLHYYRPDWDYTGWNLWVWDNDGVSALTPPYEFEPIDGEMVATIQVTPGTQRLGYIIRYGEWEDRDIYEDQFIRLTGILSGTVDVYVQSGVRGYEMVIGDDVVYGPHAVTSSYRSVGTNGGPQLMVQVTSFDNTPITVKVDGKTIPVTDVKTVGNVVFLDLGESIASYATYTVTYNGVSCSFTRVS